MMWRVYIRNSRTFGPIYERIERRPNWVARTALVAAALVVLVPLLVLFIAAIVVGAIVFLTLALIAAVLATVANLFNGLGLRPAGRKNVRVIERP